MFMTYNSTERNIYLKPIKDQINNIYPMTITSA